MKLSLHSVCRRLLTGVVFSAAILTQGTVAQAFDVQLQRPSDAVGSGYGLFTSQTLEQGRLSFATHVNYVHHPLELGRINNDPRILGVVDSFVTTNFLATFGVLDRLNLTVDLPVNLYHNIAPTIIPTRDTGAGDLGDLRLSAKWQIINADDSKNNWGLAFAPFVTLPTGEQAIYFGNSTTSGGATVVGEKKFGDNRLYLNMGAKFREREALGNLVIDDEFLYGVGYQQQLSKNHGLSAIAEVQGSTTFRKFFNDEVSSPLEIRGVLQKDWLKEQNLHSYLGAGAGLTNGYGTPDFRVMTGLSVDFSLKGKKTVKKSPAALVEIVHFANDKDNYYNHYLDNIENAANFYKQHTNSRVSVEGHTDHHADENYNMKLSARRTQRVANKLVEKGVPTSVISQVYKGETQPIDTNETPHGRQNNRRVEIRVTPNSR